jgi:isopenicillin N synthase-like dioxygenase
MAQSLPIIDFEPFLKPESSISGKRRVALEIDRACRQIGFFYLKNHGVSAELMSAMLIHARTFFESATQQDKERIALKRTSEGGDNARGWLQVCKPDVGSHEVTRGHFFN